MEATTSCLSGMSRSGLAKRVVWYAKSRDQWKAKRLKSKKKVRSLQTQLAALKKKRDEYKQLAQQRGEELEHLRQELEAVKTVR